MTANDALAKFSKHMAEWCLQKADEATGDDARLWSIRAQEYAEQARYWSEAGQES